MQSYVEEDYDVLVVGAGHAGCEAALAAARLGLNTIMFTVSVDSIALMPCNPNVGGSSKGHLVREIDALGGEMGKNIDKTFIQSKMLNSSKGPAVHSLRAQADKREYSQEMRNTLENTENLTIRQAEVAELIVEDGKIKGAKTYSGAVYHTQAVVLCTGTYLKARCIYGDVSNPTGPNGLQAANHLTDSLKALGIEMFRFKTGTPARVDKRSIDFSKMEEQFGDERVVPFSFSTDPESVQKEQVSCWLTYTNPETHKIIKDNIDRSPLFSGMIEGTGPRYCPSIEDKVMKFADKERHQVFIEPEGLYTNEMYLGGMSSSLPEDVQYKMYRTVPGLENVKIVRNAYAIEYDCINPRQLLPTLEFKEIKGLFSGGQFNGSSGYEEAAAQGLIAGMNAALEVLGKEQVIIDRSEGYIGVLIDDLVTKENHEPYRMMTSRAEYRLLLRQDNADLRLTPIGYRAGLVSKERYEYVETKRKLIQEEIERLEHVLIGANKNTQEFLMKHNSSELKTGSNLAELIRRPELDYAAVEELDEERRELPADVIEQVNINIKYEGYITRQLKQVEQFKKLEGKKLRADFDYSEVQGMRKEAVQKLNLYKPLSIGQASRISGVSPADISVQGEMEETVKNKTDIFIRKLKQIDVTLDQKQMERFELYYEMLIEKNKVMNLTAITEPEEVIDKHFVDSLAINKIVDLKNVKSVIDIGTGAGFPGIPLKIAFPWLEITLLDSLNKRIKFLDEVVDELRLEQIKCIHGRSEDIARQEEYREKYDLCVSRAVANLSTLSELCIPFVKKGGEFISYKAANSQEEIEQAGNAISKLGGRLAGVQELILPDTDMERIFVCIKKEKNTGKKYPRKAGTPGKEPL